MVERPRPTYRDIRKNATTEVDCRWCGICCELSEGNMVCNHGDVNRWIREGRQDILKYVRYSLGPDGQVATLDHDIWQEPGSEFPNLVVRCPFLECGWENGFRCSIWATRPHVCADYEVGGERCLSVRHRLENVRPK